VSDRQYTPTPGSDLAATPGLENRDRHIDLLLGPGAQVRAGVQREEGCIFVAGIGLPFLRDLDFGMNWLALASELEWPDNVVLEDMSYAAHRAMHRLQEVKPSKLILVACMPRGVDVAGTIRRYRIEDLPSLDVVDVHERLVEAVGGIVDLDHTIAVCRYWKALPDDTTVIEVEPAEQNFGLGFSPPVEVAVGKVIEIVRDEVSR
jgi:hydrogenase maturation protease